MEEKVRYHVSICLVKEVQGKRETKNEDITSLHESFDDYKSASNLFRWLENSFGLLKFHREDEEYVKAKRQELFKEYKK